jgi:hypothetical protein
MQALAGDHLASAMEPLLRVAPPPCSRATMLGWRCLRFSMR